MKTKLQSRGLVWDIETSPLITYSWGIWEANAIEVIEDKQILTVAWQWVGEKRVHVVGQNDYDSYRPGVNNDLQVVKKIRSLLDECDYAIAHNGDQFDVKIANARMMVHGLTPPSPYKQIDTKKIAKRVAGFTSNRLKDLAKDLNVSQKGDPGGFATWKGCLAGDQKAWRTMKRYNKQDIPPLLDIYMKMRSWDTQAFPLNVAEGRPAACKYCGSNHINAGMKYRATNTNLYQYFRCMDCGGNLKSRIAEYKQPDQRMKYV